MPYNGSGTFLPYVPGNPVITGTVISSTAFNATQSDIAAGLSNAVTRDGQSPATANLPMGGQKLTGLGAGTVSGDSLRWEQLFSQGTEQDIASAATTDVGGLNTTVARITGTTTITSFGTNYNGPRYVRFAGALTLTHNASTLILPTGANITTVAGDRAILTPIGNPASGWQVLAYQRASGAALNGVAAGAITTSGLTMATARALGRLTASTGAVEELTSAQVTASLVDAATTSAAGKSRLATSAESIAGTDPLAVITPSTMKAGQIVLGTPIATTSGTFVEFTGLPSWVKRVHVIFNAVSTNGTDNLMVQIGGGSLQVTGYLCNSASGGTTTAITNGFVFTVSVNGASTIFGHMILTLSGSNLWVSSHTIGGNVGNITSNGGGTVTLPGALDRVRIATTGSNTFDSGTVNVSWE